MEDSAFSAEFCSFIQSVIPSVAAAELLLLVGRQPERSWTLPELLRELPSDVNMGEKDATACLDALRFNGLVEIDDARCARYRPASDALAEHVRTLAQAYNERPVTLIRMIYALRDSRIRSFADAFKFRKR